MKYAHERQIFIPWFPLCLPCNVCISIFQEPSLPSYQEKAIATSGLLSERPQLPLNLMGPMSEEEQRCWQKGANSDTSLRLYKKVGKI